MTAQVVPAPVHDGRRLDWFPRFDPASLNYPMAAGPASELPGRGRLWTPGPVLDQGAEGACVGFGCAAEAAAQPVPVPRISARVARGWYRNAQRRDQWPGETYDGTSVLAGCLEGRARGLYTGFRWAKRAEQLAAGIVDDGPAVIGVEWREGSYSTDELGVLRPSGSVVGGHCVCVLGFVPRLGRGRKTGGWAATLELELELLQLLGGVLSVLEDEPAAFIVQNSWGVGFGKNGLCVVPLSVVQDWARAGWEAAQPVGRRLPKVKGSAMTQPNGQQLDQLEDVEDPGEQPATDVLEDASLDDEPEQQPGDATLHITAAEVLEGDRILDPPDELGQESVTVRGVPRVVQDHRGRRVVVSGRVGTFTLGAGTPVTVRRQVAG